MDESNPEKAGPGKAIDAVKAKLKESLSEEEFAQVESLRTGADAISIPEALTAEDKQSESGKTTNESLVAQIREMSVPQKIKLAMFGNREARAFLIRDTNRLVPLFVLDNARLTQDEVVEFSRNTNLDESIFRAISNSQQWMKNPTVKLNLVSNPRVPVDLSLRWLKYLQEKDLRLLARSKNISSVVANQARRLLEKRDG